MNNEREKEIEHVNPLNNCRGLFKQRVKARQHITYHLQQSANISISGLLIEKKRKGRRVCSKS